MSRSKYVSLPWAAWALQLLIPAIVAAPARALPVNQGPDLSSLPALQQSNDFQVWVNGQEQFVYESTKQGGHGTNGIDTMSFLNFDISGVTTVAVKPLGRTISSYQFRPLSAGVVASLANNTLTFTIATPQKLVVIINGSWNPVLVISADPAETPPSPASVDHYFGPGIHDMGDHWEVHSGDDIYIADGAIFSGSFNLNAVENVKIYGRGIVYTGYHAHQENYRVFKGDGPLNVTIEGVTVCNSPGWVISFWGNSRNLTVRNVKMVGMWYYNTDGVQTGTTGLLVEDCFMETNDDTFSLNGTLKDVIIRDNVLWNIYNGGVFMMGWVTNGFNWDNWDIHDNVIIRAGGCCDYDRKGPFSLKIFSNQTGGDNIRFRNIIVEDVVSYGEWINLIHQSTGICQDITFENIEVLNIWQGVSEPTWGRLTCTTPGALRDIYFNNVTVKGIPLTSAEAGKLLISGPQNVQFNADIPLYFTQQPQNAVVGAGADAQFDVAVSSQSPVSYQWYRKDGGSDIPLSDGAKYAGALTDTLTVENCQNSDEASYFCAADNAESDPVSSSLAGLTVTSANDLAQGLLAYWPGEGDMQDASGNNHDGTKAGSGSITYVAGKVGSCFLLDGNCAINAGTWDPDASGQMSIALWVNMTVSQYDGIIAKNGAPGREFALEFNNSSNILEFSGNQWLQQTGSTFTLNAWHHVVITCDQAATTAKLYIDGAFNRQRTDFLLQNYPTSPIVLGAKQILSQAMAGSLDEVAIWGRVLTDLDIAALWNNGNGAAISLSTATPPGAVQNLQLSGGHQRITASWQPPLSDGDSPILAYHLYRGATPGSLVERAQLAPDQLSYIDTDLTKGDTYYYAVAARNAVGLGPQSEPAAAQALWNDYDLNSDGIVDLADFALFAQQYLWQAPWHQP